MDNFRIYDTMLRFNNETERPSGAWRRNRKFVHDAYFWKILNMLKDEGFDVHHSWMDSNGNPAAMMYAIRTGSQGFDVPIDNEVVYGKIGSLGYLFHVSELILPKEGE